MEPRVSVIIPTHNSAKRIGIPLEALMRQRPVQDSFAVIIIDNASTDGTSEVALAHPARAALAQDGISVRVIREERKGLTFARIRGVREAVSEIVCFLDDDTAPEPDYIAEGVRAFNQPAVGMLISRVYPKYEIEPPPSIARRHLFATNHGLGNEIIEWGPEVMFAPTIGAGMWVRRDVFLSAVPWDRPEALLSDRYGNALASGGDIEIGHLIGRAGYKRVYWPGLKLWHHIPENRLQARYYMRLIIGIVRSQITLNERYGGQSRGIARQVLALAKLLLAFLSLPVLLVGEDGIREALFVLTGRYAHVLGSYDATEPGTSPSSETRRFN